MLIDSSVYGHFVRGPIHFTPLRVFNPVGQKGTCCRLPNKELVPEKKKYFIISKTSIKKETST